MIAATKRRGTGADVHHRATREIERTELVQPAVRRPHPMRERIVDERRPHERERGEHHESNPLHDRSRDQRDRDAGEHRLEPDEREMRDRRAIRTRLRADAEESSPRRDGR